MSMDAGCGCGTLDERLAALEVGAAPRFMVDSLRRRLDEIEKRGEIRSAIFTVLYIIFIVGWLAYSNGWVTFQRATRDE